MNKDWSQKNKKIQTLLGRESTYREGIQELIFIREELFEQIANIVNSYPKESFYQMPFPNANGYHCKTLAYSIWHIFRIEDIVAHELIKRDKQILFTDSYEKRIHAPIITTGNELDSEKIIAFSKEVDAKELVLYARAVMESTNAFFPKLSYDDMKRKFTDADKKKLVDSKCVSTDENAVWLIDYWCSKDVRGLLKMPFSRHWIMHIEAMLRILKGI